jgi:hypothetical protein
MRRLPLACVHISVFANIGSFGLQPLRQLI